MVKIYSICVIVNLNQKYILKLLFLQSTAYIFAGIKIQLLLYARSIAMGAFRYSVPNFFVPPKVCCAQKSWFCVFVSRNKNKNLVPLTDFFALQTSKPVYRPALCQPTLSNLWHSKVLISESANVSDFSPHIIFAVSWHGICDLTVAMIDKTLIAFMNCVVIRSLCLL